MTERWLPVPGFAGRYEVSNFGRLRSLRFRGHDRVALLTPSTNYAGYAVVTLGAERKQHRVACLVLEAFVGPRPEGMHACHGPDFDKSNNRLDNLRWDTAEANNEERVLPRDEQHYNAKLTREDKVVINKRRSSGEKLKDIANDYGVSPQRVYQIHKNHGS